MSGSDLLLVVFLGATLFVRVLTDDLASPDSRQSGSLDLSGAIAALFIVVASGLLLRRRRGFVPTIFAALWLCVWTLVAVSTHGASTETLREGVREGSIIAVAVLVCNARGVLNVPTATRLVQFVGIVPAVIALYQLVTHTGADIHGSLRSNGTFAHPDGAAMFFVITAIASLWLYLDHGRRRFDAFLTVLFAASLVATLSIGGLVALVAMLVTYAALRSGSLRSKFGLWAVAGVVVVAFLATPLGAHRIGSETSTSVSSAENGEPNTSLAWRLHKWKTLLPEWEASPLFGQGLGTTVTAKAIPGNRFAGKPPHNEYIRYLVETGIAGLAAILGALAVLIGSLVRRRRIPGSLEAGTLNAPTLAIVILVGCLVNSLADNTLLYSVTGYAAMLIVAAVVSLPQYGREDRESVRAPEAQLAACSQAGI